MLSLVFSLWRNVDMELNGKSLEEWLRKVQPSQFPRGKDYAARYRAIADDLNKEVHRDVNIGAAIRGGGVLTDHGSEHIATVIERASRLVSDSNCELTPYEVYILLVAIHIHDTGNGLGRDDHERKSLVIFRELGSVAGDDDAEKRVIGDIAEAHGGKHKDKISRLPPEQPTLGQIIRTQLLAAILKFADELSDDFTRASRFMLDKDTLPKENEVYHAYSRSLHSVVVDPSAQEVKLHFHLSVDDVTRKFGKDSPESEVYLIDEIFRRTIKTHLERTYCMRFMNPTIRIIRISVRIEIFANGFFDLVRSIDYRLQEKGYPSQPVDGIYDLCNELTDSITGEHMCGEVLKREIEDKIAQQDTSGQIEV